MRSSDVVVDDDLEVIDLTEEEGPGAAPPRHSFRPSRHQVVTAAACAAIVAIGGIAL